MELKSNVDVYLIILDGDIIRPSRRIEDRRRKRDLGFRLFLFLSFLCWILFIAGLVILHRAQPEFITMFDRFYHLKLRSEWDTQYVTYMFYTIAGGFFISLVTLVLGRSRARRKTDHKEHLIFLGCLYVIMTILTAMLFLQSSS